MTWIIRLPDHPAVKSDDFTLDDLGKVEAATGTAWAILNPFKDAKVAREFCRIALRLVGDDPSGADSLTLKTLKSAFDWEADEPFPNVAGSDDADPLDSNLRSSLPGARPATTGSRPKRERSA